MKRVAIALGVGAAFVTGIAVGKTTAQPKFIAVEEVKWEDVGGPKLALLSGDPAKGPYAGLLRIPAGTTSPFHSHTGAYEAVEIQGTSSHWLRGEDGTKAKKMTPGSYWTIPAKMEHVSSCAKGMDCIMYISQKTKFDIVPGKEVVAPTKQVPGKEVVAPTKQVPGKELVAPAKSDVVPGKETVAPTKK